MIFWYGWACYVIGLLAGGNVIPYSFAASLVVGAVMAIGALLLDERERVR